ncbi:MAG TPA: ATP-binding protein [Bryobacteraceae bacterium]|nr:ATP-binding protein [Bryobacteraceae bacterium]
MTAPIATFYDRNQAGLCRELDRVYAALTGGATQQPAAPVAAQDVSEALALNRVCQIFGLTPFERDVLLLCAGVELEARFAEACAAAQNDSRLIWPTFSLALNVLTGAHWSAVSPDRPLRLWRLVATGEGAGLVRSPLRISERIVHYLAGVLCTEQRLEGLVRPLEHNESAVPESYAACAAMAAHYWAGVKHGSPLRPVLLAGRRSSDQRTVVAEVCRALDLPCAVLLASELPANVEERALIARLWNRETLLTGALLFVRTAGAEAHEAARLASFLECIGGPVAVEVKDGSDAERLDGFRIAVPPLAARERKAIWVESLGDVRGAMNGSLDRIADYFDLDAAAIRLSGEVAREAAAREPEADVGHLAWQACRVHARRSFEGLARRIQPTATWDDLVLPELQIDTLRQIAAQVRQRPQVHGKWGFAERYSRGLGVTALFSGASGTGKTMAAEVVAAELDLDLYQIDLSGVVNKYIGETEKNLRRIFDAAEDSGAVLLFDEADALFGKRSEVRDSHDRYANLEVSYLLQRMESYHGLAILTTNMKHALDSAFVRRIRFIVQFPFPGAAERKQIWQRVFPERTPVAGLDFARISQLNVAGGMIRNIATNAAFLAADQGAPVGMEHILRAARVEYAKLDRPLTPAETGGWA